MVDKVPTNKKCPDCGRNLIFYIEPDLLGCSACGYKKKVQDAIDEDKLK